MPAASLPLRPFRVLPRFLEKVWGSEDLSPWFPGVTGKTGEAWFTDSSNLTSLKGSDGKVLTVGNLVKQHGQALLGSVAPGEMLPLLVKFLFPTEKLSVQVHPGDAWAAAQENSLGKTEMWHVLRAEPGATVAAGFTRDVSRKEVKQAAEDGSIEALLRWWPVQAGDTIYIPAGTVHAIGPGLVLCEIQQASDVTYRLYDYGRPRDLHLEQSLAVATLGPHPGLLRPHWLGQGRTLLAQGNYFRTEQVTLEAGGSLPLRPNSRKFGIWIVLEGAGTCGDLTVTPGDVWVVPAVGEGTALLANQRLSLLHSCPSG
ncbi:MAG: class I mannose-6-phosphate isomerase [Bryobacterales bacterium]|nr:class I mannose-6-phosphate isomerase [Bryobacterales bacterium]